MSEPTESSRAADVAGADAAAHVRVLKGAPTPAQLAAVISALRVVLAASEAQAANSTPRLWARPQMRATLPHGRGLWAQSLRNR